ncbi:MAG: hypothetical protein B7Z26_10270, partial [Asticcacaulis sp. 32-58-5]
KSTDTLHKSYLLLTGSGDNAAVFETEFCARAGGRDEPEQTERQIAALTSLRQQANLDIARYSSEGDALNACARASARLTYSENITENYDILALSYSDADGDDQARAVRYKAAFNQAKSEQTAAETLKSQTCAKVVFKDPPPKPPLPQSDDDKALTAIMSEYLSVLEGFKVANKAIIAQDFKTACAAVKDARLRSDSAETRVRELILKLSNEGKDTQKHQDLLKSFVESRKEIAKIETKVCTEAKNEDRAKAMEAEVEQRFESLQAATNELNAAIQNKDVSKTCTSSRQAGQDLRRIIALMHEAMAMEGEMASAELSEAETALNNRADAVEQAADAKADAIEQAAGKKD